MKYLKIFSSALLLIFLAFSLNAQSCCSGDKAKKGACCSKKEAKAEGSASTEDTAPKATLVANEVEIKTEEVKVYGNCGMCKRRIEGALADVDGVQAAEWDMDTKMLTVSFDSEVITLESIQKKVAAVGHDTDDFRAADTVYEKLHGCCKYDRPAAK